jgi:hypothetical protein
MRIDPTAKDCGMVVTSHLQVVPEPDEDASG